MQVHLVTSANRIQYLREIEAMHRHRHSIFVDLMGWRALESPDGLDIDEFDTPYATYFLTLDDDGIVRGCDRLIPTWRPHMLKNLFPEYASGAPPVGPTIWEWTRHAPGHPSFPDHVNREAQLLSGIALLEFAASRGIEAFTGILETRLLPRVAMAGWNVRRLGEEQDYGEGSAVGVEIPVNLELLHRTRAKAQRYGPVLVEMPAGLSAESARSARRPIELAMQLPETLRQPATDSLNALMEGHRH